jgi:hypothetical protein
VRRHNGRKRKWLLGPGVAIEVRLVFNHYLLISEEQRLEDQVKAV